MRARLSALIALLITAVLAVTLLPAAPAQAATATTASVFTLTNSARTKAGLKPLIADAALDAAAQAWAQQLASSCSLRHSTATWRSGRTAKAGWKSTGENIASGYASATSVMTAWMGSPGHKTNILSKSYTGVGVGTAKGSSCGATYWVQVFGSGVSAGTAGAGDADGDFDADVVAKATTGFLLYDGNGKGGWAGSAVVDGSWPAGDVAVTMGDFSGDGIADIGRIGTDGVFELLKGTGNGAYATPVKIGTGWQSYNLVIGGIDFDGDRRTDVLARTPAGALYLYRGNGTGAWHAGRKQVGRGWQAMTAILYAGDFNGDGRGDIIARSRDGKLWLYPTNGASGWRTRVHIGNNWQTMTAVLSPGDFNGDGKSDVIARTRDGRIVLYRGTGKGTFGTITVIGEGWQSVAQIG